jgi:hypothetical protein
MGGAISGPRSSRPWAIVKVIAGVELVVCATLLLVFFVEYARQ